MVTARLDWARAGALSAGLATLIVVWLTDVSRLGYFSWRGAGLVWTWLAIALVSVPAGATLGHRAPGPLRGRLPMALLVGAGFEAVLFGLLFLLATAGLHDGGLTTLSLVLGSLLVAWGLRRLPRSRAARAVLVAPLALLALVRLLVTFPLAARHLERRLFPLPPTVVRNHWNVYRCWAPCADWFGRVIDWRIAEMSYEINDYDYLTADVRASATVEVLRPYLIDGCNDMRLKPPEIPDEARGYASTAACRAANPLVGYHGGPQNDLYFRKCCLAEIHERHPGDRFESKRTTRFVFRQLHWHMLVEEPSADTPRPYRTLD